MSSLQDIVLPVEIEIAGVQLKIAKVLLTIFAVSSKEERSSRTTQQQKSSIKKVLYISLDRQLLEHNFLRRWLITISKIVIQFFLRWNRNGPLRLL